MSQRRPKDRSHWGDAAFKAMHDNGREVRLRQRQDAMVEEAADEQTRSIKAALMDALHDHAITLDDLMRRKRWQGLAGMRADEAEVRAADAEAEVARLRAERRELYEAKGGE